MTCVDTVAKKATFIQQAAIALKLPNLKGLLRRVIGKIFNELEIKGWCREFEQVNANPELRAEAAKAAEHLVPNLPAP